MRVQSRRFSALLQWLAGAAILGVAGSCSAQAQDTTASESWKRRSENAFAFALNPLGIQDAFEVSWTRRLNDSEELLHKDAHVSVGVFSRLSPAFARAGAWFEYSPLSIVDLRVGVEPVYYFGTYKAFLPFESAEARFDDDVIESRVKEAASGFAGRIYLAPALKARMGSVVTRVRAEVSRWKAQKTGEPHFYEPVLDTLIKASGSTVLTVEALALREFKLTGGKTFLLGPVYDLTAVSDAGVNQKQDVALLAVWSKSGKIGALKDASVVAKIMYFLQDPWRRHQPAAQIAFVFSL